MTVKELKNSILNKTVSNNLLILKITDTDFVAHQYYKEIANIHNLDVHFIDTLEELPNPLKDVFGSCEIGNTLNVYCCDEFNTELNYLSLIKNLIVVTKKINNSTNKMYEKFVVEIPKLEEWQIKDLAYSKIEGVDTKNIDWLVSICGKDVYRLNEELDKIAVFNKEERNYIFNECVKDGVFNDLITDTVFSLTNAITKRDINTIKNIYHCKDSMDLSGMGLLTILYQSFKNIINVQLGKNPTEESCGISSKQIYAIKKNQINYRSKEDLLNCFDIITDLDRKIKIGYIKTEEILDYILVMLM